MTIKLVPGQWVLTDGNGFANAIGISQAQNSYGSLLNQQQAAYLQAASNQLFALNNASGNAAYSNAMQSLLANAYNSPRHIAPPSRLPSRTDIISQMGFSGRRRPVRNRIIVR